MMTLLIYLAIEGVAMVAEEVQHPRRTIPRGYGYGLLTLVLLMDTLLTLLGVAGCTYIMGVPGADDIMLNYQSTSFHDALYVRQVLGLRPAPEFEAWLQQQGIFDAQGQLLPASAGHRLLGIGSRR